MNTTNREIESEEEWRQVPGFPDYEASNLGRIRCLNYYGKKGKIKVLPQSKMSTGYLGVHIRGKMMYVHRLVALAFIPNPDPEIKTTVNHRDENKLNNNVCNLEWVTVEENNNWGSRNARMGESHTNKTHVLQFDLNGNFIREWRCAKDAAKALNNGKNKSNILTCCRGKIKTSHGFIWRFKDLKERQKNGKC